MNAKTGSPVQYTLELIATADATGYFSPRTSQPIGLQEMIDHLREAPLDEFMHNQLLRFLSGMAAEEQTDFLRKALDHKDLLLLAACMEAEFPEKSAPELKKRFSILPSAALLPHTPLINIKSRTSNNRGLSAKWVSFFRENLLHHTPLPKKHPFPLPFDPTKLQPYALPDTDIAGIHTCHAAGNLSKTDSLPQPDETVRKALEILNRLSILNGEEMRHEASLSPIALIRRWNMSVSVVNGRNHYRLSGIQNSYGRGLSLDAARASNLMEVLERHSAFASIEPDRIPGYEIEYRMIKGTFSSFSDRGMAALDPNAVCLEVPYSGEELHWIEAETIIKGKPEPIRIPAQMVFPFCNLDEPALFSGLGSTGLASGNTMEQAKVSALLEVMERDAEATTPFDLSGCFRAETNDPEIGRLFAAYRQSGIDVLFQDLTSTFGIPCCKCFVRGRDGSISKGVGAHLSARKALLSALTETPYPFPGGPVSARGPENLVIVPLENLPDYSTGHPVHDLAIIEEILSANRFQPIYVDLTRKETGIPVVRAIVPGLEIMADFDVFSRLSPRLFFNYLKLINA